MQLPSDVKYIMPIYAHPLTSCYINDAITFHMLTNADAHLRTEIISRSVIIQASSLSAGNPTTRAHFQCAQNGEKCVILLPVVVVVVNMHIYCA